MHASRELLAKVVVKHFINKGNCGSSKTIE